MKHLVTISILTFAAVQGFAQDTVKPTAPDKGHIVNILLPDTGDRFVRFVPSEDGKQQAQLPKNFKDRQTTIMYDPVEVGKKAKIAVDDVQSGNTAIRPVPPGGTLELRKIDFDRVHTVEVTVTYSNKPVQSAVVTLTTPDKTTMSKTLDPASKGIAIFTDIPAGRASLNIVYGDKLSETKDIAISVDHSGDKQSVAAAVSNSVPTLDAPSSAPASAPTATGAAPNGAPSGGVNPSMPNAANQQPPTGNAVTSLLGTLLGIGVVVGAGYLLIKWAKSGGMAATLKKAGIEVEGTVPPAQTGTPWSPNAPAEPVVADSSLCQFCGQKKDASGNCACTLGVGSAAGAVNAPVAGAAQPRLVATMGVYAGSIYPLSGTLSIGREATNAIALPNDNTVSRKHATIRDEAGAYSLVDEGSANGVYINGVRISGAQPLRPGDELQIGATRFRFEM